MDGMDVDCYTDVPDSPGSDPSLEGLDGKFPVSTVLLKLVKKNSAVEVKNSPESYVCRGDWPNASSTTAAASALLRKNDEEEVEVRYYKSRDVRLRV